MSALADKQARFAQMVGALLSFAAARQDIRVRISWAYRDAQANARIGGHPRSTHVNRLAIDLVLDRLVDGEWIWQTDSAAYGELGRVWELMGGAWGGRFNDGGHFSLEHEGVK